MPDVGWGPGIPLVAGRLGRRIESLVKGLYCTWPERNHDRAHLFGHWNAGVGDYPLAYHILSAAQDDNPISETLHESST